MAGPIYDWQLHKLTTDQLRTVLFELLTRSRPEIWTSEKPLPEPDRGAIATAFMSQGYTPDGRRKPEDEIRNELFSEISSKLYDLNRQKTIFFGAGRFGQRPGVGEVPSVEDVIKRSMNSSDYDSWKTAFDKYNAATAAGEQAARSTRQIFTSGATYGAPPEVEPTPITPEGLPMGSAGAITPSFPAFKRGVSDPTEAFWDINDRIASIRDQMAILRDDESPASKKKLQDLYEEWQILEQNSQRLMPYVFQKGDAAERMALNREELEFRREQERNVGARHAAGLGESAASRAQAAAQFAERQAFERERERRELLQFQENLDQQLRQLTMQAAQLNVPLGFQFQGPNGPVTPPTTQISLPAQAPNLQAALAAAGA